MAGQPGQECGEEGPIHGSEPHSPVAGLAFRDGDLVARGEDLGVLVVLAHGQETEGGEQIHDGAMDETEQHE
jgi:hypothetical protein